MVWLWCIPAGYLLGSVSPSYILGKLIKGIDIREHGTRNAGTVNTYGLLGLWPAVLVAAYDLLKGLLAMYVCALAGGPPLCIYLAGLAAIAGHVFPFYLRFRGGQGVATATAIMIYYLIIFYAKSWLPLSSLVLLAFCVVSFSHIGRKGEIVGSVVLPLLAVFLLVFSPRSPYFYFLLSVIVYILFINVLNLQRHRLVPLSSLKAGDIIGWRLYLRPLAFSLVIFYLQTDKKQALTAIGGIALFFLFLDLVRLFSPRINVFFFRKIKKIYKEKERKKFSSITIFLFALFLTILLFEKGIAVLAASFLTFGDSFSKFFGLLFGRRRIFEKTWEGSLAHLNACLISGYLLLHFVSVPYPAYLLGAFVSSVSEVLPLGIDDNFSVSLLSASTMSVYILFN